LLFGSSKIKNLGGDLGDAVRSFKKGMAGDDAPKLKDEKSDKPGGDAKP
jgi:Sec-independent protein translocase protein TatA